MKAFAVYDETTYFCESREELLLALKDDEIEDTDTNVIEIDPYDAIAEMNDLYQTDWHAVIKGGILL